MLGWVSINVYILISAVILYREVKRNKKDLGWIIIYFVLSELVLAIIILSNLLGGTTL